MKEPVDLNAWASTVPEPGLELIVSTPQPSYEELWTNQGSMWKRGLRILPAVVAALPPFPFSAVIEGSDLNINMPPIPKIAHIDGMRNASGRPRMVHYTEYIPEPFIGTFVDQISAAYRTRLPYIQSVLPQYLDRRIEPSLVLEVGRMIYQLEQRIIAFGGLSTRQEVARHLGLNPFKR